MGKRVLIGMPDLRNVPHFAMGHPSGHADLEEEAELSAASEVIGGNHLRELQASGVQLRVLEVRTFVPPKSALYTLWLEFDDESAADAFSVRRPDLGLVGMLASTESRQEELQKDLRDRVAAGQFDVSRLPERRQLAVAKELVGKFEEVSILKDRLRTLTITSEVFDTRAAVL